MKKLIIICILIISVVFISGCTSDEQASSEISMSSQNNEKSDTQNTDISRGIYGTNEQIQDPLIITDEKTGMEAFVTNANTKGDDFSFQIENRGNSPINIYDFILTVVPDSSKDLGAMAVLGTSDSIQKTIQPGGKIKVEGDILKYYRIAGYEIHEVGKSKITALNLRFIENREAIDETNAISNIEQATIGELGHIKGDFDNYKFPYKSTKDTYMTDISINKEERTITFHIENHGDSFAHFSAPLRITIIGTVSNGNSFREQLKRELPDIYPNKRVKIVMDFLPYLEIPGMPIVEIEDVELEWIGLDGITGTGNEYKYIE